MNRDKRQKTVVLKVLRRVKKYWPAMILSLCLAFLYVAVSLRIPILVGRAIDKMIGAGQVDFSSIRALLLQVALGAGLQA